VSLSATEAAIEAAIAATEAATQAAIEATEAAIEATEAAIEATEAATACVVRTTDVPVNVPLFTERLRKVLHYIIGKKYFRRLG